MTNDVVKKFLSLLPAGFPVFLIVLLSFGCSFTQHAASEKIVPVTPVPVSPTPRVVPEFPGPEPTPDTSAGFRDEWKNEYAATSAELERNLGLWKKSKIVNYDFVTWKMAGGTTNDWNRSRVVIKVREGEKSSIELEFPNRISYMARTDGFEEIDTIDKLFDYLQQELKKGMILEMRYHKTLGYPKNAAIVHTYHTHGTRAITIFSVKAVK